MHRLFVGLRPPPEVRAQLLAAMGGVAGARWQDDDQLHITLRFIGEVERPVAEDIAAVLSTVHAPAGECAIQGVGRFGSKGRTHTLWAGVVPAEPLAHIHRKIDAALIRLGLEPEGRAYTPHITLARLSVPDIACDRYLADHAGLASAPFALTHMLLFESLLGRTGARYEAVARYPLDG